MQRAAIVLAIALAACSQGQSEKGGDAARHNAAAEVEDNRGACALAGARDFAPTCTRDVSHGGEGEVWVVRHPDGGFRRFVLIDGGKRIATADGAEEVRTERVGGDLEVRVGLDRYRFPAAPEPLETATHAPAS